MVFLWYFYDFYDFYDYIAFLMTWPADLVKRKRFQQTTKNNVKNHALLKKIV
jgi:hypothetical protein